MKTLKKDKLEIKILDSRLEAGFVAAEDAAQYINTAFGAKDELNIVFAAAPSQNEFLSSLLEHAIDWGSINAFHMDEYIGLVADSPQRFSSFLNKTIFDKAPFKSIHYLDKLDGDPKDACNEYSKLLTDNPIDIVFMGIGENGHIAFNDPHVALFDDKEMVKLVELDDECRNQQVNDACFDSLDEVPRYAITLTIPTLMKAKRIFCIVPASSKAKAVAATICGEITEQCPASILRTHPAATLYCDRDSGVSLLSDNDTQKS